MRELLAKVVAGALLAPVVICAVQLVADLRAEPFARIRGSAQRMDVPVDAGPGQEFRFEAPAAIGVEGILLASATYATHPRATIEVCVRERCREHHRSPRDGELVVLPLPGGARDEPVRVRVGAVHGGRLAFWGGPGEPGVTWLRRGAWADRVARADAYARAFGVTWLRAGLVAEAAALVAATLGALGAAFRLWSRARPPTPKAQESDRGDNHARTAS